jgi:hypothetical protein
MEAVNEPRTSNGARQMRSRGLVSLELRIRQRAWRRRGACTGLGSGLGFLHSGPLSQLLKTGLITGLRRLRI